MPTRQTTRRPAGRSATNATAKRKPSDELMTILDMCGELRISRRTFYRWKAAGDVPELVPLPGGEFRAYRSDYQAWLLDRAGRVNSR
jgi:predicted DNA-binding transcriptional regulator AlpA